jgi:Tfp pilus assembly protein PilO
VEVPVDIKMRSGFFPTMIFLDELARLERIVNIDNLSVKSTKTGLLEILCTLVAYRFKETAEATPEAQKRRFCS